MDSESLHVLHMCMVEHMRKLNMHQSAAIFAREAGISDAGNGLNLPDGFLGDWFSLFWDSYNLRMYDSSTNEGMVESSAQAEARSQGHVEAQHEGNALALVQAQGQAHACDEDLSVDPTFSWVHGQVIAEDWSIFPTFSQVQAYAEDWSSLGPILDQHFPFHVPDANVLNQPLLAPIPICTNEQHGVHPCKINVNIQQGLASAEPSSNPRQNRSNPAQTSRRSLHRASRPRSQIARGSTSNASPRATRVVNQATSEPLNPDLMDFNAT